MSGFHPISVLRTALRNTQALPKDLRLPDSLKMFGAWSPISWRAAFRRMLGLPTIIAQTNSRLLQQPIDILYAVLRFLPPESAVALSLTCKVCYHAFFQVARHDLQKAEDLLLLLEKDLSYRFFYCDACGRLHRFSSSWSPDRRSWCTEDLGRTTVSCQLRCRPHIDRFCDLCIAFHQVRFVMNWHHFGHGRGLPLSRLELIIHSIFSGWTMQSTARVIEDELFVSISHKHTLHGAPWTNRRELELSSKHQICHHRSTDKRRLHPYKRNRRLQRIPELSPWEEDGTVYGYVKECRSSPGSCSGCHTRRTPRVGPPTGIGEAKMGCKFPGPSMNLLDAMLSDGSAGLLSSTLNHFIGQVLLRSTSGGHP